MNCLCKAAVLAAFVLLPAAAYGQERGNVADDDPDEIVVIGRSVTTSAARIEVDRELVVDSATVLKELPGANVNSNGPITGIAQYRGMFGDRVAVDVDNLGVISGGPNAMDAPLSYTSPMITKELVVERGIASVSSAPESIGGHVHAKLARGDFGHDDVGLSGFVGTRFATNGGVNTTAGRLSLANVRHRVSTIAEVDTGDDLETPKGDIRPSRIDRRRYDISYAFRSESGDLLAFAGRLDTRDTGTPALPMDIRYIETDLYGIQGSIAVSSSLQIEARFAYNDVSHLMDNFGLREVPDPMRFRQNLTHGKGYQFGVSGVIAMADSDLRIGLDGISAEHDSTITNPNSAMFRIDNFVDIERDLLGAFAEWTLETGASDFELGVRYKRVEATAGDVGVRGMMGAVGSDAQRLADDFNAARRDRDWNSVDAVLKYRRRLAAGAEWTFEIGRKTRAPSYQELYLWLPLQATGGLADGRSYIGNLDLDDERAGEIAIGLSGSFGRLSLAPQLFYRRVDDFIQGTPSDNAAANAVSTMMSGNPALQWTNVDAEFWGLDLAWKFELSDSLFLDGIASFVRGRRTDVSDNLYRLAPVNGSIALTWQEERRSLKTELVAYARQDKVSSFNDEQPTPGYELVNVAFAWQPHGSLRVEARLDNLFDTTYQDHLAGINRARGSDIVVGERLYGIGRTLSAGLIYSF